jgi:hypothetical protein
VPVFISLIGSCIISTHSFIMIQTQKDKPTLKKKQNIYNQNHFTMTNVIIDEAKTAADAEGEGDCFSYSKDGWTRCGHRWWFYNYKACNCVNGIFSMHSVNAIFSLFSLQGFFSLASINALFAVMAVNSTMSVLSFVSYSLCFVFSGFFRLLFSESKNAKSNL